MTILRLPSSLLIGNHAQTALDNATFHESSCTIIELPDAILDSTVNDCAFFTYFSQSACILFAPTYELSHPVSVHA